MDTSRYLGLFLLFLCVWYCDAGFPDFIARNGFDINGANVCRYPTSRSINVTIPVKHTVTKTFLRICYRNFTLPFFWFKMTERPVVKISTTCKKYKNVIVTTNETVTRTTHGYSLKCCLHWKKIKPEDTECKKAICPNDCVHGRCIAGDTCVCDKGWQGYTCNQDINECYTRNGGCQQECYNHLGSYMCVCRRGYQIDPKDPFKCIDINECNATKAKCVCTGSSQQCKPKCINKIGSYMCQCPKGYRLIGPNACIDVDECLSSNDCQHKCINTLGSYKCECFKGMAYVKKTNTCEDINECRVNNGGCAQKCLNTYSSYRCRCKFGYRLNKDRKNCIKYKFTDFDD